MKVSFDGFLCFLVVIGFMVTLGYAVKDYIRPHTFVAICSGQKYQFKARGYRVGPGGCVTFSGEANAWVCGCNLVAEVHEGDKK